MEYEEAKEKIVVGLTKKLKDQIQILLQRLGQDSGMKPRVAKKSSTNWFRTVCWSTGLQAAPPCTACPAPANRRAPSTKTNSKELRRRHCPIGKPPPCTRVFETGSSQPPAPQPTPGIVVAALRGGSGKTIFSVGIIAALRSLGRSVAPLKRDRIILTPAGLPGGRPALLQSGHLPHRPGDHPRFLSYPHPKHRFYRYRRQPRSLRLHRHRRGNQHRRTGQAAGPAGDPVHRRHQNHPHHGGRGGRYHRLRPGCPHRRRGAEPGGRQAAPIHSDPQHRRIHRRPGIGRGSQTQEQRFPERHMGLVPTPEHSWALPPSTPSGWWPKSTWISSGFSAWPQRRNRSTGSVPLEKSAATTERIPSRPPSASSGIRPFNSTIRKTWKPWRPPVQAGVYQPPDRRPPSPVDGFISAAVFRKPTPGNWRPIQLFGTN
jgi:hypothetical protein